MPKKPAYSAYPTKKQQQNKKLTFEERFEGVTTIPLIIEQHDRIKKRMQKLSKILYRFAISKIQCCPTNVQIMRNYVQYYHEYYEYDQFDNSFQLLPSLDVNINTINDQSIIYKSFNLFKNSAWQIRFGNKFTSRIKDYSLTQIQYILSFVMMLSQGNFHGRSSKILQGTYGYMTPIEGKSIPHNRFFIMKIFREKNLIVQIGVEKNPIVRNGVIKRYEFQNYIQLLDIVTDQIGENPKKLGETITRFQKLIEEDVAKRDHSDQLMIQTPKEKGRVKSTHMFQEFQNPYTAQKQVFATEFSQHNSYNHKPFTFKPLYVSVTETSTLIFDKNMKRWVSSDYLTRLQKKAYNEYQKKINEEMIKRFVDFQSAKTLVQLLTKIPNFRVSLTEEEKNVIGENGNVLVIGRSGTGKTTCAVLRLFAIQMLFKIRLSLSKKKYESQLRDTRCSADDIDQTMGLHCIFLTASPVLTNQIQRYYKKLTDNIKTELQKKKKKIQEQKAMMKKKEKIQQIQVVKEPLKQINDDEEEMVEKQEEIQVPGELKVKKSQQALEEQEEMNKEFEGIKMEEQVGNQTFKQDDEEQDEDIDHMKEELQAKMRKFKSLEDMTEEDYPGFFTVKNFIMMIDATLKKPFFIRKKNDVLEEDTKATWHNERKGVMMIETYHKNEENQNGDEEIMEEIEEEINYSDEEELEHEYLRQIQLIENRQKQKLTEKLAKNKRTNLSFEVDYDYFETYFWPTVKHRHYSARNITPHLVWTQIFSTIKGGASSHLYPGLYLPEQTYIKETTNVFLTKQEKLDIFETYCQYERWKSNSGGYDLMDAVNYILNFIRFRGYDGPEIHYIMIDEVQDLPHAIIYLLSKAVTYGVFYSGDTAQTIAKGIGFRFCDLKNLFDPRLFDFSLTLKKPTVKQLTVNFRSHNNILQLANSVVSSIQLIFPKTIDRLKKQVSNISGPKPIILADEDEQLLFYVLCGDESYKKKIEAENEAMKKPPLQFGCDQVIIVRDQESKNKIPSMLQHALCLTIYEAKGLEFNDVILFNFFTETKCADRWNLLKFLKVIIEEVDKEVYEKNITRHEDHPMSRQPKQEGQEEEQQVSTECFVDKNKDKYLVKKIVSDAKLLLKDINDYAQLCSQLKMLYTAITRPRKTLIIYDQESGARKNLQKLWDRLEVIELVNKQLINETGKKKKQETQQIKIFKSIINSTDHGQWKKQGIKMYSRGFFEQAMKCFEKSGNKELYKKALGNSLADNATKKLIQIDSERSAIKNKQFQFRKMNDSEISKLKKRLKKQEVETFEKFSVAAVTFEELMMFKQAGQCYFSGKKYQKAFDNFSKAFMNKQAAESLQMMNKYRQASDYYEKDGNYIKMIECLDLVNEWENILKVIHRFSQKMSEVERQSLLKKYSSLALQELVYEIEFQNEVIEEKPQNNRVQIIKEQESDDEEDYDDWDSDQDPQLAAERSSMRKKSSVDLSDEIGTRKLSATESQPRRKGSQIQTIKESVYEKIQEEKVEEKKQEVISESLQKKISEDSGSFADLNDSKEEQVKKEEKEQVMEEKKPETHLKSIENSFADLNSEESSFADLNSIPDDVNVKLPPQLEPDIESIRSMADPEDAWIKSALSEIQAKTHTQYSIIDQDQNYNPNVRIIKTKGNIFIQDQIMKKIVGIVSIINTSIHEFFKQFKGYQSLITVSKDEEKDVIDNRPEISEFEDVDPEFINIILDTLESFKLYKLCLFVCNRYHMPHKAGRYLVSMALKYSTNAQVNNVLNPSLLSPSIHRKMELQKGILASIAIHAIFQNISSDFLKIKVANKLSEQNKNTLGCYFIEGLILEGLYKKAVFIVNTEESLKILKNFFDFSIYREVFKQKVIKLPESQQFHFLKQKPKTKTENQYTFLALQNLLYDYNFINKNELFSQRNYKQISIAERKLNFEPELIPEYCPLLRLLLTNWKNEQKPEFIKCLENELENFAYNKLIKGQFFEVYDTVSTIVTILTTQNLYNYVFQISQNAFLELFRCIQLIRACVHKQHISNSLPILESVLSLFHCRIINPCTSTRFINDGYTLVKRGGIVINQFVELIKKEKDETAYFFEQDYNLVIVRSIKLFEFISKKLTSAFGRFMRKKIQSNNLYRKPITPQDFTAFQTQQFIKTVLRNYESILLNKKKAKIRTREVFKKKEKPKFDYKSHGKTQLLVELNSDEEQSDEEVVRGVQMKRLNGFIFNDLNPKLKYLSDPIFKLFNEDAYRTKSPINGKVLFCSGMNDSYKEYIDQFKGYNLYDAIEFKKFKRLDLYTDNILSVIHDLSTYDKHMILSELLTLLLVQYKCLTQGKNFKLDVSRHLLKHLPGLKLVQILGKCTDLNDALDGKVQSCVFSYKNQYASEMGASEIGDMICQLLEIIRIEENSKYVNFQSLVLAHVLNIPPNQNIYEGLRLVIQNSNTWTNPLFHSLKLANNYESFCAARQKILLNDELVKNSLTVHEIKVEDCSKLNTCIQESERDYAIKEFTIKNRKKVVKKIATWWRAMRKKEKNPGEKQILKECRIAKCQHQLQHLPVDDNFLKQSSNLRNLLLNFYLRYVITSSLDFHFILMTLNKIQDLRETYLKAFEKQAFLALEQDPVDVHEEINDLKRTFQIWKNDGKWLKDRNIDLKRKKVFEVKWMTKSSIQSKLASRRAGLKKQKNLQEKKEMLKALKRR